MGDKSKGNFLCNTGVTGISPGRVRFSNTELESKPLLPDLTPLALTVMDSVSRHLVVIP
ncbi:MAG: hypothetical protein ACI9JR_002961 [Gammaproteobacteria bacterium]|jgi:hypothetical protein